MLIVSEAASGHLAEMLDLLYVPKQIAIRFVSEVTRFALESDRERPGDAAFQHENRTVLLLDGHASEMLDEVTLGLKDAKLTLRRLEKGRMLER
jgi:hypothetical protein